MADQPDRSEGLVRQVGQTLRSYARGQFLVMLVMMGLYAAGFAWVEVPLWFLAALVCGLFHWVPMVGSFLAVLVPVGFALIGGGGFGQVLQIVAVFVVAQLLETFYLTPKILGRELRLSPLLIFLAVLVGGLTLGVLGALLAPPLVAVGLFVWRPGQGSSPLR